MRSPGLGAPFANHRASDAEYRSRRTVVGSPSSKLRLVLAMSVADMLCLIVQMFPDVKRFRLIASGRIKGVCYCTR